MGLPLTLHICSHLNMKQVPGGTSPHQRLLRKILRVALDLTLHFFFLFLVEAY